MRHYLLKDIAKEISIRENNPSSSKYDKFVGLEHYESGEIEIHKYGKTDNLVSAMKVFQSGDILVARRNVYLKRASRVNFSGLTSGDSIILRANNSIYEKILPFILNTENFWEYADKYSDGTMSKRLSPKTLLQYEFDLPETTELEKLIEILWAAEETKQAYKKLLQKTDDMVKAKFEEMFGNRNDGITIGKLEVLCRKKTSNLSQKEIENNNGIYPVYGASGFIKNIDSYDIDSEYLAIIKDGAGVGRIYKLPAFSSVLNTLQYIIPFQNVNLTYLLYVIRSLNLENSYKGATIPHIYFKDYSQLLVPIADIHRQNEFAKFAQQAEQSKQLLQKSLDSLNATMRALINENLK